MLACGDCPGAATCGGDGVMHVCPGAKGTGCAGLSCQVQKDACSDTSPTTLTGTVYDPAGNLPLYNALVYVPNAALEPIQEGVLCDKCGGTPSGQPIATALSDINGKFTLSGVPSGSNVPLVVQVGK